VTDGGLEALAARFAANPDEFAALVARVDALRPGVTSAVLGSVRAAAPKAEGRCTPDAGDRGDGPALSTMTDALMLALDGSRGAHLRRVTVAAPPGLDVRELVGPLVAGSLGSWLVTCRSLSTGAEHVHGLVATAEPDDAGRMLGELVARHRLDPAAVHHTMTMVRALRGDGVSLRAVVDACAGLGLVSRSGRPLSLTQVARIVQRAEDHEAA
jgi:hypothetical protein